jgi:hypothetical protein
VSLCGEGGGDETRDVGERWCRRIFTAAPQTLNRNWVGRRGADPGAGALAGRGCGVVIGFSGNEKRTRFVSLEDEVTVEGVEGLSPKGSSSQPTYDSDESQEG